MALQTVRLTSAIARVAPVIAAVLSLSGSSLTAQAPGPVVSGIVTSAAATKTTAKWGELSMYFRGESFGTTNLMTAVVVINPGDQVHAPHRHADEEFITLVEGSGRWNVAGKETPARKGDFIYASPWTIHTVINDSDKPLTFVAVRFSSKGVKPPPEPPIQKPSAP